jgi:hypothetical protein
LLVLGENCRAMPSDGELTSAGHLTARAAKEYLDGGEQAINYKGGNHPADDGFVQAV